MATASHREDVWRKSLSFTLTPSSLMFYSDLKNPNFIICLINPRITNRTRASLKLTVFLRQLCSLSITIVALWLCRCHSNVFSPPAHLKSVREVLVVSEPDLQKMTGLSRPDVQELLHAAATACRTHQPITGEII